VSTTQVRFRLSGTDSGVAVSYVVQPGANSLGTHPGNDLVLREQSVSRQHAELTVDPDSGEIEVRDTGSTNGTFVNGRLVTSSAVHPGDRLTFGGVTLAVEEAAADDTELAVALGGPPDRETPPASRQSQSTEVTGAGWMAQGVASWQDPLEQLVADMTHARPVLSHALHSLLGGLGTDGGCVVTWPQGTEPIVHASWGRWHGLVDHPGVLRRVQQLRDSSGAPKPSVLFLDGHPASTCVLGVTPEGVPRGLLINGAVPGERGVVPLLRTAYLLLAHGVDVDEQAGQIPPQQRSGGLVLPEDYVACRSSAMSKVYAQLTAAVESRLPVLLVGETGVGKEPLARAVHLSSDRKTSSFVTINCAAIPSELLEAELFGIGAGVATGVAARSGRFAEANGGTVFLDEIGDMPLRLQAKLLRLLQEREIQPVGASRAQAVDVAIVAATNRRDADLVGENGLREDLYYRLAGCRVRVPPLRERREDIPVLLEHFARRAAEQRGAVVRGITVRAMEYLEAYPWPGNVRELEHQTRRMVSLCPHGQAISASLISEEIVAGRTSNRLDDERDDGPLEAQLAALERRILTETLASTGGNKSEAARRLGISRNGLARRLRRLGLSDP
jgi:DNA-binding NtrC family response regulator